MTAPSRTWLLLPGGLCLAAGLVGAVLLTGVTPPSAAAHLPDRHGIIMTLGFLGTVIALERSVALRQPWAHAAPGLLGAGGIVLVADGPRAAGAVLLAAGLTALLAVYARLYDRQRDAGTAVEALGSAAALVAVVLWLRVDVPAVLPWLVSFVVLTIAAERVELARLQLPSSAGGVLLLVGVSLLGACTLALLRPEPGVRVVGAVLLALAAWLARHDVARRTLKVPGRPRFAAVAMLLGYAWLVVGSLVWLLGGPPASIPAYDSVVHSVFLGFAMSMVLAHATIILPAVIRRPVPHGRRMWVPLVVLHAGLLVRVGLGDGLGLDTPWEVGAHLTVAALVLLPLTVVSSLVTPTAPTGRLA
ncbi:hypothetical protein JNO54_07420 [Janibacter sp. YIM B02568]|uniref:hypothetical protein n=1 Tax=Janibacter endophyticus TaxID=2806261 RepID=UPI001950C1C6|nr:hypothetical protein [Janibacter endophyticus]MBM6545970.1 hypothetical protein [Janibacter endophyticus]